MCVCVFVCVCVQFIYIYIYIYIPKTDRINLENSDSVLKCL